MTIFLIVLLVALIFEYINGFHDAAALDHRVVGRRVRPRAGLPVLRNTAHQTSPFIHAL